MTEVQAAGEVEDLAIEEEPPLDGQGTGAPAEGDGKDTAERAQSTIAFPYDDLKNACEVARIAHQEYGGSCTLDQLAAQLGQTTTSGAFRLRVAAARTFGLITVAKGTVATTSLGARVADDRTATAARVEAFLGVPLYHEIHERFRGRTLPNLKGVEQAMASLGVVPKQVTTARQVFTRSAEFAGFFAHGRDRLIAPAVGKVDPKVLTGQSDRDNPSEERSNVDTHPLIVGLLGALPKPGEEFPQEDRDMWLEAAKVNLQLIYGKPRSAVLTPTARLES